MSAGLDPAVAELLLADPQAVECPSVADWWPRWRRLATSGAPPVAMAARGGFAADRVGWAFASGYQAALRTLVPALPGDAMAAFCVTEEGGNRPRDIATRFAPQPDGSVVIDGAKRWTTLGPDSRWLLVVGAMPQPGGASRPALKVARLRSDCAGVSLLPMPPTRFVPEVPHARVRLQGVRVEAAALLPGDGYAGYVKPFRSLEDAFVTLAVLAHLLREARRLDWPAPFRERLCAALALLAALARSAADDAATHVALAGALAWAHRLYEEAAALWAGTPDAPAALRWTRDAPLFAVAASARERRAARAWERLAAGGAAP